MKKRIVLLMVATMTMGMLAGCGSSASDTSTSESEETTETEESADAEDEESGSDTSTEETGNLKFGFTADYLSDFMSYVVKGVEDACADYGVEITVQDAEWDTAKQLQQVENFITSGMDAVIVKTCDSANCQPILDACTEAGIPFVCVNNTSDAGCDCYVGSDNVIAGQMQAEYLNEALPDGGQVGVIQGDLAYESVHDRTAGAEDNLNDNFTIYSEQDCGWMRDEAMDTMENWLSAGADLQAIIANNDEMAIGAAKVLKENGVTGVTICGIDASEDALDMIESGDMAMTCFQNGYQQGYTGVEMAIKLANGEEVEEYVDIPYETVTKDNVQEYKDFYANMK